MNIDAANIATNQTATLENEATPDVTIFFAAYSVTTPAAAVAISAIDPDPHFLLSGLKLDTDLFLKGTINIMDDKETVNNTPASNTPDADNPDTAAQNSGSTDSNTPYSLRQWKLAP